MFASEESSPSSTAARSRARAAPRAFEVVDVAKPLAELEHDARVDGRGRRRGLRAPAHARPPRDRSRCRGRGRPGCAPRARARRAPGPASGLRSRSASAARAASDARTRSLVPAHIAIEAWQRACNSGSRMSASAARPARPRWIRPRASSRCRRARAARGPAARRPPVDDVLEHRGRAREVAREEQVVGEREPPLVGRVCVLRELQRELGQLGGGVGSATRVRPRAASSSTRATPASGVVVARARCRARSSASRTDAASALCTAARSSDTAVA